MPHPSKGRRQALTVRLPFDVYVEAARRAGFRQWSISHFVAFCVAQECAKGGKRGRNANRPQRVEAESPS